MESGTVRTTEAFYPSKTMFPNKVSTWWRRDVYINSNMHTNKRAHRNIGTTHTHRNPCDSGNRSESFVSVPARFYSTVRTIELCACYRESRNSLPYPPDDGHSFCQAHTHEARKREETRVHTPSAMVFVLAFISFP